MNVLMVNGKKLPGPNEMSHTIIDVSNSERNAKAVMIFDMVREDVHRLDCKWGFLTNDEYYAISQAIAPKYNLDVSFFIPDKNKEGTVCCYVTDRTVPVSVYENGKPGYANVSMAFVEM